LAAVAEVATSTVRRHTSRRVFGRVSCPHDQPLGVRYCRARACRRPTAGRGRGGWSISSANSFRHAVTRWLGVDLPVRRGGGRRRYRPADRRHHWIGRRPVPVATAAVGSGRGMVGIPDRGFRTGIRRGRRA